MSEVIREYRKSIKYGEAVLRIYADIDPLNPRTEYEHFSVMACKHPRYDLGDEQIGDTEEFIEYLESDEVVAFLPLYLYDHGGLSMSTGSFSCPWDSGQVGWIYCNRESVAENWSGHSIPDHDKLIKYLDSDVEEYNNWLSGSIYGFTYHEEIRVNPAGDLKEINEDSCWGFNYSDWDDMIRGMLEHCSEHANFAEWVCQ